MADRLPGWDARLCRYIAEHYTRPFRYGRWDCALFTAGAVAAMTGVDHAAAFARYRSRADGLRVMRGRGFADHIDYVRKTFAPVGMAEARAGDIAVIDSRTLGVVQGAMIYTVTQRGIGLLPRSDAGEFRKL